MPAFITGFFLFSLLCTVNLFIVTLLGVTRLAPTVGNLLWAVLLFSRRFHVRVLTQLAPFIKRATNVDLLAGLWRLLACSALSLLVGGILLFLLNWHLSIWILLVFLGHGVFVDLTWEETFESSGIEMGEQRPWNQ